MSVSVRSLSAGLRAAVGGERVTDDASALASAAIDRCAPRFIVRAAALEHVAGTVALAWEEGLSVVPRGSASTLALGFPPDRVDIVLDMTGLDRVLDWNPDDLTATVQAGCTAGALAKHLGPRRQFLPLDVPGGSARTIGGLAATGATAPLRMRYGGIRDLLLGVRFVQADGVTTWGGARVVKSVTGYDVPKLMVGAMGTLGVLCELTLRLHPIPDVTRTWLAMFRSADAAQALVAALIDSPIQPSRVEWLNARALERSGASGGSTGIVVSIGSVPAAVAEQGEALSALVTRHGGEISERADGWWDRYAGRFDADALVARIATLPSRLSGTVADVERLLPGALISGSAAIGAFDVSSSASAAFPAALERLRGTLASHHGHAIVMRAPLDLRRSIDPWGPVEPEAFAIMRALRDEFDPKRVLNPGRFVGRL